MARMATKGVCGRPLAGGAAKRVADAHSSSCCKWCYLVFVSTSATCGLATDRVEELEAWRVVAPSHKGPGQVLRGVWLDSDLNNTPQPNTEVHSVVLRCGTLAEHAAVTVPTCRQHWRPVMTVALKALAVSGSMSNFVDRAAAEHAGTRLGCGRVL